MTAFIVLFLVFMLGAFVLELILGVLAAVFKKEKFRLPHFVHIDHLPDHICLPAPGTQTQRVGTKAIIFQDYRFKLQ